MVHRLENYLDRQKKFKKCNRWVNTFKKTKRSEYLYLKELDLIFFLIFHLKLENIIKFLNISQCLIYSISYSCRVYKLIYIIRFKYVSICKSIYTINSTSVRILPYIPSIYFRVIFYISKPYRII